MHWFTVVYSIEPLAATAVDSSMDDASGTSDDDNSLIGDFLVDDGDDWRAQVVRRQANHEQLVTGLDPYRAHIDAGLDPGAGADDEAEDDVDIDDRPARRCRFVDDESGDSD